MLLIALVVVVISSARAVVAESFLNIVEYSKDEDEETGKRGGQKIDEF